MPEGSTTDNGWDDRWPRCAVCSGRLVDHWRHRECLRQKKQLAEAATMTNNIFDPGHSDSYQKVMKKARRTNKQRDRTDKANGFASPGDGTLDQFLRNAISAIVCGLEMAEWSCVAEGLDMLQQAELRSRQQKARAG